MHSKAIFFDLYQTLVDVDVGKEKEGQKAGFEKIIIPYLLQKGVPKTEAFLVLAYYSDRVRAFYNGHDIELFHHDFSEILSNVFRTHYGFTTSRLELSDLIYEFRKISRGHLKLYEGAREALEILSTRYTLVVASYTQGIYSERELEELGILRYFTHRIYSSDIGFKKKSSKFYEKCLEIVGLDAKNCLMVGDNLYEDIYIANQSGMHTLWIMNPITKDGNKAEVEPEASLSIKSIRDLPSVIMKILG